MTQPDNCKTWRDRVCETLDAVSSVIRFKGTMGDAACDTLDTLINSIDPDWRRRNLLQTIIRQPGASMSEGAWLYDYSLPELAQENFKLRRQYAELVAAVKGFRKAEEEWREICYGEKNYPNSVWNERDKARQAAEAGTGGIAGACRDGGHRRMGRRPHPKTATEG